MIDDDVLAIVAALEFVTSRAQNEAPKFRWKASGRDYAADEEREPTTWRNS